MKEIFSFLDDFNKRHGKPSALIRDIVRYALYLIIPTIIMVIALFLHSTLLAGIAMVAYIIVVVLFIVAMLYMTYTMATIADFIEDEFEHSNSNDEEDVTETKIVFRIGDRVRAIRDGISYGKGDEGFVKNLDNPCPNGWGSMEVSFINPGPGKLCDAWVGLEDFELVDHKEDV